MNDFGKITTPYTQFPYRINKKNTEITCYTVLWSNCNGRLVVGFTTTYTISAYNY